MPKSTQTHNPIPVGIIGQGRSGWNIHAATIDTMPQAFKIACVADHQADRRAEAAERFGCEAVEDPQALIDSKAVKLVVVASPSQFHAEHAEAAMRAGKHVVVEKPLANSTADVDRLIATAKQTGTVLAPFQNMRFDPLLRMVQAILAEGKIGRPIKITCCFHNFARRWDWQTLNRFDGGALRNTGIHALDQAMEFLGETDDAGPKLMSHLDRAISSGDAEDFANVTLCGTTGPLIQVEVGHCFARPHPRWNVVGEQGAIVSDTDNQGVAVRWTDLSELPSRDVDPTPTADRSYNSETYKWQEENRKLTGNETSSFHAFYEDLHAHLTQSSPLTVTPQSVRERIAIIERCGTY